MKFFRRFIFMERRKNFLERRFVLDETPFGFCAFGSVVFRAAFFGWQSGRAMLFDCCFVMVSCFCDN